MLSFVGIQQQSNVRQGKEGTKLVKTTGHKLSLFPQCDTISLLKSDQRADYWKGQCILLMKEALGNATANVQYIHSLIDETQDLVLRKHLVQCYDANVASTIDLPDAIDYAAKEKFTEVNVYATSNSERIKDCEMQFSPRPSPLFARNNLMYQLLCKALEISAFFLGLVHSHLRLLRLINL